MEFDVVQTLITSVGFPITCVIFLGMFIYRFCNQVMTYNKEREDKLYILVEKSQEQLDRLEDTLEDYITVLGKLRDDVNRISEDIEDIKNGK